jgi:hypothetical protein
MQAWVIQRPALVCITKEVLLPWELRDASKSLWMMLREDMLLAFEVSSLFLLLGIADWSFT